MKIQHVIDAIIRARCQYFTNLPIMDDLDFVGVPKGFKTKIDLTTQEQELFDLSQRMSKSMFEPNSTLLVLLKNSPDSMKYLLDKCLVKPISCQIQGEVFFDFFLFSSAETGIKK